ncbi:hypothetical protein SAMN05428950_1011312 [Sphingomonas sp. OV641]|uniref:hypothetical protein n=1 Tax=Sphingomonas sp. OV641 TaxID=1881068 RepID=UPI0008C9EB34|nr:hypothetical protein [Sphingomonas sp. OV641]SEJ16045.1 hypothetical protein SAMN05428950_1011312 [Sphingomonas sp. OV641]
MMHDILHSEGSDSIVIVDRATGDDIAEVFHCDRHTVNQTRDQALETAALYAAAPLLLAALQEVFADADCTGKLSWMDRAAFAIASAARVVPE